MDDGLPLYEIRLRADGEGFDLTGPLIHGRIRYHRPIDAHDHWQRCLAPVHGARLVIYDSKGIFYGRYEIAKSD